MTPTRYLSDKQCLNPNSDPLRWIQDEQPYCECAKIGKRPLSWTTFIPEYVEIPGLNSINQEPFHEHIVFEESRDNIGYANGSWTQKGAFAGKLFAEDVDEYRYTYTDECYDGTIMRRAILETPEPAHYTFLGINCQTYVERVLGTYYFIKKGLGL